MSGYPEAWNWAFGCRKVVTDGMLLSLGVWMPEIYIRRGVPISGRLDVWTPKCIWKNTWVQALKGYTRNHSRSHSLLSPPLQALFFLPLTHSSSPTKYIKTHPLPPFFLHHHSLPLFLLFHFISLFTRTSANRAHILTEKTQAFRLDLLALAPLRPFKALGFSSTWAPLRAGGARLSLANFSSYLLRRLH